MENADFRFEKYSMHEVISSGPLPGILMRGYNHSQFSHVTIFISPEHVNRIIHNGKDGTYDIMDVIIEDQIKIPRSAINESVPGRKTNPINALKVASLEVVGNNKLEIVNCITKIDARLKLPIIEGTYMSQKTVFYVPQVDLEKYQRKGEDLREEFFGASLHLTKGILHAGLPDTYLGYGARLIKNSTQQPAIKSEVFSIN